jgi:hypothetical protein
MNGNVCCDENEALTWRAHCHLLSNLFSAGPTRIHTEVVLRSFNLNKAEYGDKMFYYY